MHDLSYRSKWPQRRSYRFKAPICRWLWRMLCLNAYPFWVERTELTLTPSECKTLANPSFKTTWVQQSHPLKGIGNVKLISRIRVGFNSRYSCPEKSFVESPRLAKPWTFQVKLQLYWLVSSWPWSACGMVKTTVCCQWQPPMKLPRWTRYSTWWWLFPQVYFCW